MFFVDGLLFCFCFCFCFVCFSLSLLAFCKVSRAEADIQASLSAEVSALASAPSRDVATVRPASVTAGGPRPTTTHTVPHAVTAVIAELEQRVARMERTLGSPSASTSSPPLPESVLEHGVLGGITNLEARMALLNDGAYEEMSRRAKLLSTELSAASTSASHSRRADTVHSSASTAARAVTDSELPVMFDTVQQWNGLAESLPTLVDRLQVRCAPKPLP